MHRILISLPSGGYIRIETVKALLDMLKATNNIVFDIDCPMSCYIHANREKSVEYALDNQADYILFIDGDVVPARNGLTKLLSLNVPICGGVYNTKEENSVPAVLLFEPLPEKPQQPIKVDALPAGFLLIKMEVFRKIDRPWFFFEPEMAGKSMVGEDVYFCRKARKYGYDIWLDPTIEIGHMGVRKY